MSDLGDKTDSAQSGAIRYPSALRSNTLLYLENVGSQFLSLRQFLKMPI